MSRIITFLAVIFISTFVSGQNIPQEYFDLVKVADSLYKAKQYSKSAVTYSEAFKANSWKAYSPDR